MVVVTGKVDEQKNQQKLSREVGPLGHHGIQYLRSYICTTTSL